MTTREERRQALFEALESRILVIDGHRVVPPDGGVETGSRALHARESRLPPRAAAYSPIWPGLYFKSHGLQAGARNLSHNVNDFSRVYDHHHHRRAVRRDALRRRP